MKLLIDTQILIWLTSSDKRLGKACRAQLEDPDNAVLISYFSLFELTIKAAAGKLTLDYAIIDALPKMGITLVAPTAETLLHYQIVAPDNKDPFDNVLLAVAKTEQAVFVTSDKKILGLQKNAVRLMDAAK